MRHHLCVWLACLFFVLVDPGVATGGQYDTVSQKEAGVSSSSSSSSHQCTPIDNDGDDGGDAPTDIVCQNPLSEPIPETEHSEEDEMIADREESDDDDDDEAEDEEEAGDSDDEETDDLLEYFMELSTWGKPQTIYTARTDSIRRFLNETTKYMEAFLGNETNVGRNKCRNYNIDCTFWASKGECDDDDADRKDYSKMSKHDCDHQFGMMLV